MSPLNNKSQRTSPALSAGTGKSIAVHECQVCGSKPLRPVVFLGYLPPVNTMPAIGLRPEEQPSYPAELLRCPNSQCELAQLGTIVDPAILFPPSYPYTSGTTKILRDNFAEMYRELMSLYPISKADLAVDIGSNDGTLLKNFHSTGHRVLGIEPTNAGLLAQKAGIDTHIAFFGKAAAQKALQTHGKAKVITATNVFAHIEDVHSIVEAITSLLDSDGIFISESHYLATLLETVQYDTIYHEHLRYYSLKSIKHLLEMHGLEVIHAKQIPTHGGSIRVYAARRGTRTIQASVAQILKNEVTTLSDAAFDNFKQRVVLSKLSLHRLLLETKLRNARVYAIGAPSRASTLINYVGLDENIVDCVLEVDGSYKTGKVIPGTLIPVVGESKLFTDQPEFALLLSWHIADELIPKLRAKGFKGGFIVPLPEPRIIPSERTSELRAES